MTSDPIPPEFADLFQPEPVPVAPKRRRLKTCQRQAALIGERPELFGGRAKQPSLPFGDSDHDQ